MVGTLLPGQHSQTKKLQYASFKYMKLAFKSVLSPCTSYISCYKKLFLGLINPIQARGVFRDPSLKFSSITLEAYELIL